MNKFRIGDTVVVLKESSDSHLQGTVGTIVNIKSISSLIIYRVRAGIDDKEYEYFENEIGPINPNQKNNITNKEKNNMTIFKENDNLKLKNGKVGTVSKVIYEKIDEKDNYGLYAYQMIIDNQKCLIYPEQIDTKNEQIIKEEEKMEKAFSPIKIFEKVVYEDKFGCHVGYFYDGRIKDRTSISPNFHVYEIRHDDECQGNWAEIAKNIMVNFWGSLITETPIPMEIDENSGKEYTIVNDYSYLDRYFYIDPLDNKLVETF